MKSLCASNSLNIKDEIVLVDLFEKYLAHRDTLPPLEEDTVTIEKFKDLLKPEEIEKREKEKADKKAEEQKKHDEEQKQKDDAYNALSAHQKFNRDWELKVKEIHADIAKQSQLCRLNKDERRQLFKTIRYSFCKHEDLLALLVNPRFAEAKDFVA